MSRYWYREDGAVRHWFCGVFEGGGAKGAAYAGALDVMREEGAWFRAVAGASAGAITAALIASGMEPARIGARTDAALSRVRTGVWAGLKRLQRETGYFPSDELRGWLQEMLRAQVPSETGGDVTFAELYDATGIGLYVVAADLSLRTQVVFSHLRTPSCAVADGVIASSSIPFAFASRVLEVKEGEGRAWHHTVVDGGVWSNFPMYVFEDRAFRRSYEQGARGGRQVETDPVLGFLLDEGLEPKLPYGDDVRFVGPELGKGLNAWERRAEPEEDGKEEEGAGLASRIGAALLLPLVLLARLVDWNGGVEPGRWPAPASRLARSLLETVDGLLGGIHPVVFALVPCAVVALGSWTIAASAVADQVRVLPETDWGDPFAWLGRAFILLLVALVASVAILVFFGAVLVVAANRLLLRTLRRLSYGLAATYVAGSGAPAWAVERDNVIALPIPPEIDTLRFDMDEAERSRLVEAAREATRSGLARLLPRG